MKINNRSVFIAELIDDQLENKSLGQFKITTVFVRRALAWDKYNATLHHPNTLITWSKKDAKKHSAKTLMPVSDTNEPKDYSGAKEVERGCKVVRDPLNDKNAIRKRKRNRGENYSPDSKKGTKKARVHRRAIKPPCAATCCKKCATRFDEETRVELFNSLWEYADLSKQHQFIVANVIEEETRRTRVNEGGNRDKRKRSLFHSFNGVSVCKTMFLNTLSISKKMVRTAIEMKDKHGAFVKPDSRGKAGNRKFAEDVIDDVKLHIKSFPTMEAHYVRERSLKF